MINTNGIVQNQAEFEEELTEVILSLKILREVADRLPPALTQKEVEQRHLLFQIHEAATTPLRYK